MAETMGTSLVRVGVLAVTWPANFLPEQPRAEVVDATTTLFSTANTLHLSIVRATIGGLSSLTRQITKAAESAQTTVTSTAKVSIEAPR
jgi:hypothetical protein